MAADAPPSTDPAGGDPAIAGPPAGDEPAPVDPFALDAGSADSVPAFAAEGDDGAGAEVDGAVVIAIAGATPPPFDVDADAAGEFAVGAIALSGIALSGIALGGVALGGVALGRVAADAPPGWRPTWKAPLSAAPAHVASSAREFAGGASCATGCPGVEAGADATCAAPAGEPASAAVVPAVWLDADDSVGTEFAPTEA